MSTQQRGDVFRAECHPGECFKPVDSHSNLRNWVLDNSPISEFCFDRIGRGNPQGTQNGAGHLTERRTSIYQGIYGLSPFPASA